MNGNHWSNENLLDRLYGLRSEDAHLEACEDCRLRWQQLLARRQERKAEAPEVPADLLAEQRRRIYERIESGSATAWNLRLIPGMATALLVLLGVLLSRPAPTPEPTLAVSDSQFFSEIYSVLETSEPRAAAPIHALFEEQR